MQRCPEAGVAFLPAVVAALPLASDERTPTAVGEGGGAGGGVSLAWAAAEAGLGLLGHLHARTEDHGFPAALVQVRPYRPAWRLTESIYVFSIDDTLCIL